MEINIPFNFVSIFRVIFFSLYAVVHIDASLLSKIQVVILWLQASVMCLSSSLGMKIGFSCWLWFWPFALSNLDTSKNKSVSDSNNVQNLKKNFEPYQSHIRELS